MKMFAQHRILLSTRKCSHVGQAVNGPSAISPLTAQKSAVLLAVAKAEAFAAELPLKSAMLCTHLL
jgi:hypothetical protein